MLVSLPELMAAHRATDSAVN